MTKEDYMKFSKDMLAELLAKRDSEKDFASGVYYGLVPSIPT